MFGLSIQPCNWRPCIRLLAVVGVVAISATAPAAQLALPGVRVPPLAQNLAATLAQQSGNAQRTLDDAVTGARRGTAQLLIRRNSPTIEADPNGDPIVRAQIVAIDLPAGALQRIAAQGFGIVSQVTLAGLDSSLTVLSAPRGTSTRRALQRLRSLVPDGSFDYNHIYGQGGNSIGPAITVSAPPSHAEGATGAVDAAAADLPLAATGVARVGLIDGGIDAAHAAFRDVAFKSWGCHGSIVPTAHGTAVASLLVGSDGRFRGAAPGADLYAADVYCGAPAGGSIDSLASAFDWMSVNQVPVINVSLVGPGNVILQQLVRVMTAHGHLIVAAVGNDGPAAAPLYPAAYPDVIGVTAVDARRHVIIEAERGRQVHFAAPGADMAAAGYPQPYAAVRGTSFAAPIVAGLLALQLRSVNVDAARVAVRALEHAALDVGAHGQDNTYGFGLVGESVRVPPDIMQSTEAHAVPADK